MTHLSLVPAGPGAPAAPGRYEISPTLALVIGRDASCDIRVDESQDVVSRRHVTIRWDGQALVAHDGSTNGLFINGQRVANSQPIHDEDVMQLGHNGPVFTVALDPKPVKAPPPAKETRMLAPTRPPQPVIKLEENTAPSAQPVGASATPSPAPSTPQAAPHDPDGVSSSNEALQDIARGGKQLLSSAAASIKRSMEEQSGKPTGQPLPTMHRPPSTGGFFFLSRLIVQLYKIILEIILWIFMLTAIVYGWKFNGMLGALGAAFVAALAGAFFFGAFLLLGDIRLSVRRIEERLNAKE